MNRQVCACVVSALLLAGCGGAAATGSQATEGTTTGGSRSAAQDSVAGSVCQRLQPELSPTTIAAAQNHEVTYSSPLIETHEQEDSTPNPPACDIWEQGTNEQGVAWTIDLLGPGSTTTTAGLTPVSSPIEGTSIFRGGTSIYAYGTWGVLNIVPGELLVDTASSNSVFISKMIGSIEDWIEHHERVTLTPQKSGSNPTENTQPPNTPSATSSPAPAASAGGPSGPDYSQALAQWNQGVCIDAAQQGQYWHQAAADLQAGLGGDTGDASGYQSAISSLNDIAGIPDTNDTPAQQAEYQSDAETLDTFFSTPGLYISNFGSC